MNIEATGYIFHAQIHNLRTQAIKPILTSSGRYIIYAKLWLLIGYNLTFVPKKSMAMCLLQFSFIPNYFDNYLHIGVIDRSGGGGGHRDIHTERFKIRWLNMSWCDVLLKEDAEEHGDNASTLAQPITMTDITSPPQVITAVRAFPHVCSCWFTNLRCARCCQDANLKTPGDKRRCLSEPAAWDWVTTKVTPDGVCRTVGARESVSST